MAREVIDRREGRSLFGSDPAGYDLARPGHAERVYEVLVERCGLGPGTRVLEIGPGTGQATRRLLELGADPLVAVEPDAALAEYLTSALNGRPDIRNGALEDVGLPAEWFDLAVAASSFHWIDEEIGLAKVLGALRPGRWWAMWWTHFGDSSRPDSFREATQHVMAGLPSSPSAGGRALDAGGGIAALEAAGFERCTNELVRWSYEWDAAGIRALYATFSPVARLETAQRESVLDEIARVATDEFGGRVEKPLLTSLFTACKPTRAPS